MRGRARHRRENVDPLHDAVVVHVESTELEGRRDEDRAVQPDAGLLLEHPHEPAYAVAAVALARDKDRRAPAVVLREPARDELTERLEIALGAEILVLRHLRLAA